MRNVCDKYDCILYIDQDKIQRFKMHGKVQYNIVVYNTEIPWK